MADEVTAEDASEESTDPVVATARGPEVVVALGLIVLALLAISDSWRVGISWADDGPRAGYFPFYVGLILLVAASWILIRTLLQWRTRNEVFIRREELSGVLAVLWPSSLYVAVMPWTGLYIASIALIAFFMRRHGHYGWAKTALVSVGVVVVFFIVFERWFLVPLPKGPLENALGL